MSRKKAIEQKLSVLNPHILEVVDKSAEHAGHAANPNTIGNSHFSIQISSDTLESLGQIEQHRIINGLLKDEFANGLHALSIKVLSRT